MKTFRKPISFLIAGILMAFLLAALCGPLVVDCVSILRNGWGTREYLAAGANGDLIALISRDENGFRLTRGDINGRRIIEFKVSLPLSANSIPANVYPASNGAVFFSLYETNEQPADTLSLYRATAQDAPEKLLSYPCTGAGTEERMRSTFFSGFAEWDRNVQFALTDGDTLHSYVYGTAGSGLVQKEPQNVPHVLSAAFQADGTIALGGEQMFIVNGKQVAFPLENFIVTHLTQVGAGFFCIDNLSLKAFYCDPTGTECVEVFDLGEFAPEEEWNSLSFVENEKALLLRSGHTLSLVDGRRETALNTVLYRAPVVCVLLLLVLTALWFFVTAAVWYLVSGRQNSHLPLAIHMGALLLLLALAAGKALDFWAVRPFVSQSIAREARNTITEAASLYGGSAAAETLTGRVGGEYTGAESVTYEKQSDIWRVQSGGTLPSGSRAVLSRGFDSQLFDSAEDVFADNGEAFSLYLKSGNSVTQISVPGAALHDRIERERTRLLRMVGSGLAAVWLCAFAVLLLVGKRLRRVSKTVEALSAGSSDTRLDMRTGDEFESLAASLNSLAAAMTAQQDSESELVRAYRRFVPERVLALLGRDSILNVDRHVFATHRLSAMMVWFTFPDRVYDNSTRALFDSINEVIEHTAAIVMKKGGTVFNFAYNGYDVVLGGGEEEAISTAVAVRQEVLSLNERRTLAGVPPVTLRIALDVGEMIIGVVGDESQMEPATISTTFTTARRLIGLARQLDASILCTENIMRGASGYGSRYIGKSAQGDGMIRVYEIYDGDPLDVRRGKANSGQRFSRAVLSLYSHDFAEAKRLFLELVHENPNDGGAKYYLYLADQLEKQPEREISLED